MNLCPFQQFHYARLPVYRFLLIFSLLSALSFSLEYSREKAQKYLIKKNEELRKAADEIKALRKIIPICSYCKKIRDDEGYWSQVEEYLSDRENLVFSHGICPDCLEKYHPDALPKKKD
ncbi:MAG: hypothetical protein PQJ60_04995, partial [Spirochaetales bacterium]|nr:hypothetical protein [Spirochaetales bacterium]